MSELFYLIYVNVRTVVSMLFLFLRAEFIQYAFVTVILTALCASLFGVTLVLKRFSFIGDGLSHVAFGAMAVAAVAGITQNMLFVMPVTVVCAVILLKTGNKAKIKGDAAIAAVSVGALAVGYLLMNFDGASNNIAADVCSALFGSSSILTLTKAEVLTCVITSAVVILVFVMFYNKIFAVTFDESFMKASGVRAEFYNLLIAVVIAVVVTLAMNLVGSLLISALVLFPALCAMRVFKSFKSVTACAAVVSVTCAVIGLLISILVGTPTGATIVAVDIAAFAIFTLIGAITGRS